MIWLLVTFFKSLGEPISCRRNYIDKDPSDPVSVKDFRKLGRPPADVMPAIVQVSPCIPCIFPEILLVKEIRPKRYTYSHLGRLHETLVDITICSYELAPACPISATEK
jgi:hypothetical protein